MAPRFDPSLDRTNVAINAIHTSDASVNTPTLIDVTAPTYAELRDLLRVHGLSQRIGNKMIHLGDVAFREQEPASQTARNLVYALLLLMFAGNMVWLLRAILK